MRLPGGRQAQPGVATGQSVVACRLGYADVLRIQNQLAAASICWASLMSSSDRPPQSCVVKTTETRL